MVERDEYEDLQESIIDKLPRDPGVAWKLRDQDQGAFGGQCRQPCAETQKRRNAETQ